ncbi:hypothetical protein SAMN05421858_0004 [Haladaptatus litoreus]|uniref:Uncharacterized protein n=1 Tax=Haladaptatus litoreus TaxID=553468 RepID=A0A1N6UKY8_9EURY|nr:hypothetical protein [Haladaptatus litoreus]SIQ66318.1 hypothetical protein SAMN05421858_0004 [Haladaptatus litoreus]
MSASNALTKLDEQAEQLSTWQYAIVAGLFGLIAGTAIYLALGNNIAVATFDALSTAFVAMAAAYIQRWRA